MDSSAPSYILAVESSCDDTAAAVLENDKVLSNSIASQAIHSSYGGVVPELASRSHLKNILPVVDVALENAGISRSQLTAIAYTQGPGLLGSLLVGSSFAQAMAFGLQIPAIPIHHLRAHILAHFINDGSPSPQFPFICLTVSGGHTQLVYVKSLFSFEILGQTLDDAAGEAFDKAAKVLGLAYPGGPLIDRYAKGGHAEAYSFTKPKVDGYNYSFSGLKTNFRNFIEKQQKLDSNFCEKNKADLCASIQHTITDILIEQLKKVTLKYSVKQIALAGGVSANSDLRKKFSHLGEQLHVTTFIPPFEYCTDNAAMIGIAGYCALQETTVGREANAPKARWDIS